MTFSLRRSMILVVIGITTVFLLIRLFLMFWAWSTAPESMHPFLEQYWLLGGILSIVPFVLAAGGAVWLLRKIRRQERSQARIEGLAEIGLLAGGLAHEIRNPLNVIQTHLSLLRRRVAQNDEKAIHHKINQLERATQMLSELLTDFLSYARPPSEEPREYSPSKLFQEVINFVELDLEQAGVELEVDLDTDISTVMVEPDKLKRALLNLIINARQAMPEGGKLTLRCRPWDASRVALEVIDTGEGIAPEEQSRIFTTFYSTKKEGSGLGLSIVKRTIEDVGGEIELQSAPGKGTTFRILLPIAKRKKEAICPPLKSGKSFSSKTTT